MVSVLQHDSKIGTGMLVAIILLSILALLGCSTVAICYFRKMACFHQEIGIQSTDELSHEDGRKICDNAYDKIEDVEETLPSQS